MASTSQTYHGSRKVKVTILASEWGSSKEELSTMNRELAIQLAKCPEVEITVFLPQCSQKDKKEALKYKVKIVEATSLPGFEHLDWLCFPPEDLQIDIVVGHGVKLGKQAQVIKNYKKCKWVQIVHTDPEELWMFKSYSNLNSKNEEKDKTEVELCKLADHVVGIGPKLSEAFRSYLRGCQKDDNILDFTPGVFEEFETVKQVPSERKPRSVLVFGRGDIEDFNLKGFDIAGRAIAALKDTRLVFVGAPKGKHEEIAKRLNRCGVPLNRLRVRGFVEDRESLKHLFQEVDLVVMSSRTEGFGLTGLEALSAGLPVVVSHNSGFGEALCSVPFGSSFVVNSEDPADWTAAIQKLWDKDRKSRLNEVKTLRDSYGRKYNWAKQIKELVNKMISLVHDDSLKALSSLGKKRKASQGTEDMIEDHADDSLNSLSSLGKKRKASRGTEDMTENYAGQSVSSILNETVPADSEDFDSKAEYKGNDGQELHAAAKTGCIEIIKLLLSQGFDIDSKDRNGDTPLMWTALYGQQGAFQMLLKKGADPSLKDNKGFSVLHNAAQGGNPSIINELLSLGLDIDSRSTDGVTPLMIAATCGKQNAFQFLIQKDADPSLKDNGGFSLLHFAATGGNPSIINKLLSLGLDIDSRSNDDVTPLMTAAYRDKQNAFQILIQKGADPSLKDNGGRSLLHRAAQGGNPSIINELLSLGLDIDSRSNGGVTPLMAAAYCDKQNAFQILIQKGADPSLKNNGGLSLLHFAAKGGNTSIINKLLSLGLDVHLKDVYGMTPLTRAIENSNSDAVKFFISKGALK